MKKIMTAIGDEKINYQLQQNSQYQVIAKDIFYLEGILELLEAGICADILMVSDKINGNENLEEILTKIKKRKNEMEIILLCYQNIELAQKLKQKGIIQKYIINQENPEKIMAEIENKPETISETQELALKQEIEKLKEQISNIQNEKQEKTATVVAIIGDGNVGKSSICLMMATMAKGKKTLLVDCDFHKKGLLRITNQLRKNDLERKIKENMYICDGEEVIQNQKWGTLQTKYNLILLDISIDYYQTKNSPIFLFHTAELIICVVEASYIGNEKGLIFLTDFEQYFDRRKLKILFNHYGKYSLVKTVLFKNFHEYSILGFIKENKIYQKNINFLKKEPYGTRKEWMEYQGILNRILYPEEMTENQWKEILKKGK